MKFFKIKLRGVHTTLAVFLLVCAAIHFVASEDKEGEGEEDLTPTKVRKDKAGKRTVKVSSTRGKVVETQSEFKINTEILIEESHAKVEFKHISTTVLESAGGKLTMDNAEKMVGKEWHNWCGCGEDACEKHTKCKLREFQPVCCNNKCKCVKVGKFELDDYWKTLRRETACNLLGCDNNLKSTCYDVSATEFNCWTQYKHKSIDEEHGTFIAGGWMGGQVSKTTMITKHTSFSEMTHSSKSSSSTIKHSGLSESTHSSKSSTVSEFSSGTSGGAWKSSGAVKAATVVGALKTSEASNTSKPAATTKAASVVSNFEENSGMSGGNQATVQFAYFGCGA